MEKACWISLLLFRLSKIIPSTPEALAAEFANHVTLCAITIAHNVLSNHVPFLFRPKEFKKKKNPKIQQMLISHSIRSRNSLSRDCQNSASMLRDHWCQSVSYFPLSTWIFFSVAVILVGFLMLVWKNR